MAQLFFENIATFYTVDTSAHPREITQNDINTFADCTGDYNPIHVDEGKVNQNSFVWTRIARGKKIAHGLLTASVAVGLLNNHDILEGMVLLAIKDIIFLRPVWPGDKIHTVMSVMEKREPENIFLRRYCGEIVCSLKVFNQKKEQVLDMTAILLAQRLQSLEET